MSLLSYAGITRFRSKGLCLKSPVNAVSRRISAKAPPALYLFTSYDNCFMQSGQALRSVLIEILIENTIEICYFSFHVKQLY